MKTKIKQLIIELESRIIVLKAQKETAEKLGFYTQCSAISGRIEEVTAHRDNLKNLIGG